MCGIAGILAYRDVAPAVDRAELACMNNHMAARGPDGKGLWVSGDGRLGFAHRRLAIIDLSERGAQPMRSADGSLTITFNGEIYNYRVLRSELEGKGYRFCTESDTEVLLQLYADRGAAMVEFLRGMFAFAIWDAPRRQLLLARDHLGIKPLYYADDGWTFRFASQAKALLSGGAVSRDPDSAGIVGFHLLGSVPEPFTVWREIRSLPAGSTMFVDGAGSHTPEPYYSIAASLARRAARSTSNHALGQLAEGVRDTVRHHLVSDVPVAIFLSAGLDSGALLGTMTDVGARDIVAVTLAFEEFRGTPYDESPLAAEVAAYYGARHVVRTVDRHEFEQDLPSVLDAMDLPTIDGINTWFVAKATREAGLKVALSGVGADECFGGYPSFVDLPRSVALFRLLGLLPGAGWIARHATLAAISAGLDLHPKAAGLIEYGGTWGGAYLLRRSVYMPWELKDLLDKDLVRDGLRRLAPLRRIAELQNAPGAQSLDDFDRVSALETAVYMRGQLLRDADWAGMAHSVEIRVPFVDPFFLEALPAGALLADIDAKDAIANIPCRRLPEASRNRSKTGFVTPIGRWIQLAEAEEGKVTLSEASRAWALRVWRAGWTSPSACAFSAGARPMTPVPA